ncbi:MAG: cation-translocating P-type ATPase [Ignavibacteria bacterium]|nr:cation-translocating P-type ATPase [Ignavibacteria bacterium]
MKTDSNDLEGYTGLTDKEVEVKLKKEGYNELPSSKPRSNFAIIIDVIKEPMFILLISCSVVYLILGSLGEALMLFAFVFVVMGITLYQERKTERALEALRDLSSPRANVIRNKESKRIPGRDVVTGDILILSEGDRVPADSILLSSNTISVDESLLTGEAVPVRKAQWENQSEQGKPGGDDTPFLFSGTLIVQGQGIARVTATGMNSEIGKIGKALQSVTSENTPLQKETGKLVKDISIIGGILFLVIIFVYGFSRNDWLGGILAGITLAMAILPEEFPVVLTIFLAFGAWRISKKHVLARKISAVETLGSASVLCVDKTGTLTMNKMTLAEISTGEDFFRTDGNSSLPDNFHELIEYSILASSRDPFDPMEKAIKQKGEEFLNNTEHLHKDWNLEREYPLSAKLLALSHVWTSPGGNNSLIAAKGAPEAIADLCHLEENEIKKLKTEVIRMSGKGLRVLGVAKAEFGQSSLPDSQHDYIFHFLGLIGFTDPVRPGVADSVRMCYEAGIRVVMITGDYPGTAQNIAAQIGIRNTENFITGSELDSLSETELSEKIKTINIFSRVVPEQKLMIVKAFKSNGEIAAMTGDGVNDAPALKAANIGIAMGGRGTDVARESSSLVILDDDFSSIVAAVNQGRSIFDNLKKAMSYIISIHIPIAGMSLIPVLFNWPLFLFPMHIAFLELIIDPSCTIVFESEPEEKDVMKRPPRNPHVPIFGFRMIMKSVLMGAGVMGIVLGVYIFAMNSGYPDAKVRTMAFTTLILGNLLLIVKSRSRTSGFFKSLITRNVAQWWVSGLAVFFLMLIINVPFLQSLFKFQSLTIYEISICFAAGLVSIMWFGIVTMMYLARSKNKN